MYASDEVDKIVEELEFIETERRQLNANVLHFRIIYRNSPHSDRCSLQEIIAVYLIHECRPIQVRLGTTLVRLFDYMARRNTIAQTAKQIEKGTQVDASQLWRQPAVSNGSIPRRYVRIYMNRMRSALGEALRESTLERRSDAVLVSEQTAMNEVGYRLRGTFEWLRTMV